MFYRKGTCGERTYFQNVFINAEIDLQFPENDAIISSRPYNQAQAQQIIANQAQSLRGFRFPARVHFDLENCESKPSIIPVAPDAPVIFISSQTEDTVTITWLHGFDGGSPITSQEGPGGNPIWGYTIYSGTLAGGFISIAPKPCVNSFTLTVLPGDDIWVTASNCVPNTQIRWESLFYITVCTPLTSGESNHVVI